jgi:hypothetical protein
VSRSHNFDEGVPPATGTLNYVIPRAAGPVRRLGLQQFSVDQTRNNELHQTVGQPGVRGEHHAP